MVKQALIQLGIVPRIALVLCALASFFVVGTALVLYLVAKNELVDKSLMKVAGIAIEKEDGLASEISAVVGRLQVIGKDPVIEEFFLEKADPSSSSVADETGDLHKDHVASILHSSVGCTNCPFDLVMFIDEKTGRVLEATDPSEIGKFKENSLYFKNGRKQPHFQPPQASLKTGKPEAFAAVPAITADGTVVGVIAGRIANARFSEILQQGWRAYETLDNYLVNDSGFLVSHPRFGESATVFGLQISTPGVETCLSGENFTGEGRDYRGVAVVGSYRWMPDARLCVVSELDLAEAYQPVERFLWVAALLALSGVATSVVLGFFVARGIAHPVVILRNAMDSFSRGDAADTPDLDRRDEIGDLARSFTEMRTALVDRERALQTSEGRFRALVDASPASIFLKDSAGRYLIVNTAFEERWGVSEEEVLGKTAADHMPSDMAERLIEEQENLLTTGEPCEFEVAMETKSGERRILDVIVFPITDASGDIVGTGGISSDVTIRKAAERELARSNAALERSNQELQQFAYIASHDLREPLRMVSSYVQLLARRYEGKLDKDADEFIHFAVDGAGRMQRLLEGLLAFSRVRTHGRDFEEVDMNRTFEEATRDLEQAVLDVGATVTHDPLPIVTGDPGQLGRIFQNLISNGIKFHNSAAPEVHVSAERNGREWIFAVRDNGIGIDPQYSEKIFEIFKRLHTRGDYPGEGLGLAITGRIVDRHGGRIWVESEPGKGATFFFTIPDSGVL